MASKTSFLLKVSFFSGLSSFGNKNKMKLIIQIPCYNEESSLPITLKTLPRKIKGIDKIEWLIIDDGSSDDTIEVAKQFGVDHVVSYPQNRGLATAFMAGLEECLKQGADIIVNTDADNQYNSDDIEVLVQPILNKKADYVIGTRPIMDIGHFSFIKKILQKFGSWMVRKLSNTNVQDAPSGFRAMNRETALKLNVFSEYTYTLETIIQSGQKNTLVISVPIRVNEDLRPSRLMKSIPSYIKRSIGTMIRFFVVYRPFKFFFNIGILIFSSGIIIGIRYLFYYFTANGSGHIQSLILSAILMLIGFQTILTAFLADLFFVNRKILEDIQYRLRKRDYNKQRNKNK